MIQKATDQWGPVGTRWWYEILDERFDEGSPILDKETKETLCKTVTHTIKIAIFYPDSQKPVVQFGHTPYIYQSKYGPITDQEAPKKSLMDAIKKALSMLGFSADVFLGEFEDESYVNKLRIEQEIDKADDRDAEIDAKNKELSNYVIRNKEAIERAATISEAGGVYKISMRYLDRQKAIGELKRVAELGILKINETYESKKLELENK